MAKLAKTIFIRIRGRVVPIRKKLKEDAELGALVKIQKARKARKERPNTKFLMKLTQVDIDKGKELGRKIAKRRKRLKIK